MNKPNNNVNQAFIKEAWNEFSPLPSDDQSHDEFMSVFMAESALDKDIQPSANLKRRFYSDVMATHQTLPPSNIMLRLRSFFASFTHSLNYNKQSLAPQFLTVVIAFTCGVMVHSTFQSASTTENEQQTLKNLLVISLLNQSSASDRLTAFNFIDSTSVYDSELTGHLLEALKNDDSDGIRLAALKNLENSLPFIRKEMIDALKHQKSILVQMTMISMLNNDHPLKAEEIELIRSMDNIDDRILNAPFLKNNIKNNSHEI